jgi:hypothetical protein
MKNEYLTLKKIKGVLYAYISRRIKKKDKWTSKHVRYLGRARPLQNALRRALRRYDKKHGKRSGKSKGTE